MKKILSFLSLISVFALMLASCTISPYQPPESSVPSDESSDVSSSPQPETDETVLTYKTVTVGKRLFKFVAAVQKGITEYAYKLAADIDFEAHPEYWDYEYKDGVTFAENTLQNAIDRCKQLAVMQYLCDNANIAMPDDSQIQAYIDKLAENYDSLADFQNALAQIGVSTDEVAQYYTICSRAVDLKKQLTGEGGALELSEYEADAWFNEYVEQNYVKADLYVISFYEQDGKTKYIDPDVTDSEATEYFENNYIKCSYIKYGDSAESLADACFEDIKNGTATIEQKLGESSDSESIMLLHYGDDFYDEIAALDINECAKIVKNGYIYIVVRNNISRSDITTSIKNACLWHVTCDKLTEQSETLLDDIKNGRNESFESVKNCTHIGSTVFDSAEYGETLFKTVKYDDLVGECDVAVDSKAVYIFIKEDVTGCCEEERDEAVSNHIDELFDEYIDSFVDAVTADDAVASSVDIKELQSLLLI